MTALSDIFHKANTLLNVHLKKRNQTTPSYIVFTPSTGYLEMRGFNTSVELLIEIDAIESVLIRNYTSFYELEIAYKYSPMLLPAQLRIHFREADALEFFLTFNELWETYKFNYVPCFHSHDSYLRQLL